MIAHRCTWCIQFCIVPVIVKVTDRCRCCISNAIEGVMWCFIFYQWIMTRLMHTIWTSVIKVWLLMALKIISHLQCLKLYLPYSLLKVEKNKRKWNEKKTSLFGLTSSDKLSCLSCVSYAVNSCPSFVKHCCTLICIAWWPLPRHSHPFIFKLSGQHHIL